MPSKNFLHNLTIPSPCTADWNSMVGNDQVRFCEHCSLDVHNLSVMTRNQAQRLVARSNGRLCVRYHSDSRGKPLTLPLAQKLHRINRRVSRIAAGAFGATLSITSAVVQNSASAQQSVYPPNATQQNPRWNPGSSLVGTVKDQNGALIPAATIFLSNTELQVALYASTGLDGQFKIENLQAAVYRLRIEAPGFAADETEGLYLQANGEIRVDRTLKVDQVEETVDVESNGPEIQTFTSGGVAIVAPEHPFVKAAHEDDLEALTALIAGIDVNLRDKRSGTTALEHAVRNANREMVQLLLSAGADVNKTNYVGETVLMMLDEDATSDLTWDLINAGANVNRKDKSGTTALMEMAASNNMDALKTLLDAGAEVNAKNEEGQTALMLAASGGYVNSVRALVLAGSDINAKDKEKMDALAHAMDNDHRVVVRFLKSKGAVQTVAQAQQDQ
jgi:hypothetical protein